MTSVFEPFGGTSAVDLTRCLPLEGDAAILLLGCRDIRHILYTCFVQASSREPYNRQYAVIYAI